MTNKTNKRRKGLMSVVMPWLKRYGLRAFVLAALIGGGYWTYTADAHTRAAHWAEQKLISASASLGFTVENIIVTGREYSDPEILLALLNIQKGDPLFSVHPISAHDLLGRMTWVKSVRVERRWPDTININLQERKPSAFWHDGEGIHLLDEDGEKITSENLGRFKGLIMLAGEKAPQNAGPLLAAMDEVQEIKPLIRSAQWVGDRRWNILLTNDLIVKMPEDHLSQGFERLLSRKELLDKDLTTIDLRQPDRIIVRTRPGAVREYKASTKHGTQGGNKI